MEPFLHGSLNNPSKDMLVRSQAAPVHNTMFGMHLMQVSVSLMGR